jgi:hypothetical protein
MPRSSQYAAIGAFALAALATVIDRVAPLPWPSMATRALAGLFLLVALTRVAGGLGVRGQRFARYGVAGVAWTAAIWFGGAALVLGRPSLGALSGLHLVAGLLAFGREADPALAERGRLIVAATALGVSLLALASLPRAAGVPSAPVLPVVLTFASAGGIFAMTRGRMVGLMLAATAGTFALAVAARTLATVRGGSLALPGAALELVPVIVLSTVVAALVPMVALARRLPATWKVLAPSASPKLVVLLAWLTYPTTLALAVAVTA